METGEADKVVVDGMLEAEDALKGVESGKISSKFYCLVFLLVNGHNKCLPCCRGVVVD